MTTEIEALTKRVEELEKNQAILFQQFAKDCYQCDGTGKFGRDIQHCDDCNGTGKVIMLKSGTGT